MLKNFVKFLTTKQGLRGCAEHASASASASASPSPWAMALFMFALLAARRWGANIFLLWWDGRLDPFPSGCHLHFALHLFGHV
jgi:MYXO-CTERM domain-containing protein